ncbi:MAG: hypothetical protein OXE78_13270 [Gammaproteobacteria bacterium]|nr:hypothetical protein [Gammaproteobacteria bacterium]MCY4356170.1 hypothetical protein [Gammaproteobacteria bacterium]
MMNSTEDEISKGPKLVPVFDFQPKPSCLKANVVVEAVALF